MVYPEKTSVVMRNRLLKTPNSELLTHDLQSTLPEFAMPDLILPPPAPLATADHQPPTTDLTTPLDQSPAAVYLAQLAKSGRRTQKGALNRLAGLLGYPDAFHCPWHQLR